MDLPGDIWSLIATHLAPEDLTALIEVNRSFFYAALNARYRHIVFHSRSRKELCDFTRLQDPFIASRVRTLFLVPTCFIPKPSDTPPRVVTKFTQAVKNFIWANNPRVIGFGTPYNVAKKMDSIFRNLKCLDELVLSCRDRWAAFPTARIIVNSAWSRLGSNIYTLTLDMSSLALEHAISPSLVFPRLEALTLKSYRSYFSTDADILRILSSISLPFTTNHRQTLRYFTLIDRSINGLDFSPFLRDLGYFPHLKCVDVSISLNRAAQGLWYFLGLHSSRLEILGLSHYQLAEPPLYDGPALAALKILSLRLTVHTTDFLVSLQRGNSIETLKLHSFTYRHSKVPQILDVFASHQMRSLSIELDFLSPQVVDLISESFPNLCTLFLRIGGYTASGDSQRDSSQGELQYCEAMTKMDYSHWQPLVFDLEAYRSRSTSCAAALKKLFPRIRVKDCLVERGVWD